MVCHCELPADGGPACGPDCLNRVLNMECVPVSFSSEGTTHTSMQEMLLAMLCLHDRSDIALTCHMLSLMEHSLQGAAGLSLQNDASCMLGYRARHCIQCDDC